MRNRRVVCSRALALVLPVTLGFGCGLKRDWSICAPADKQPCLTGYVCTDDLRCVRAGDGGSDALVRVDSHGVSDVAGGGERDWSVCSPPAEMCLPGFACTADFRCVLVAGGGSDGPANVDNRGPTDADAGPASTSTDGPTGISSGLDGPERDGAPAVVSPDALVGTAPDAPPEAPLPDAPPASLPDARVPDAPPVDCTRHLQHGPGLLAAEPALLEQPMREMRGGQRLQRPDRTHLRPEWPVRGLHGEQPVHRPDQANLPGECVRGLCGRCGHRLRG